MKLKHVLIIKEAIAEWLKLPPSKVAGTVVPTKTIICLSTYFIWEVFYITKIQGDSVKFLANELYPYLTADDITKALRLITKIDGTGIGGSGVKR